jgi:hypothetical protein
MGARNFTTMRRLVSLLLYLSAAGEQCGSKPVVPTRANTVLPEQMSRL